MSFESFHYGEKYRCEKSTKVSPVETKNFCLPYFNINRYGMHYAVFTWKRYPYRRGGPLKASDLRHCVRPRRSVYRQVISAIKQFSNMT